MSQFKKKLTAFGAMLAFLSLSSVATFAADVIGATPGDVIGNSANLTIKGDSTNLNVGFNSNANGAVGQVDWNQFNVGANQTVNFGFAGLSQTIINRVLGGQTSTILGKLVNSCSMGGDCDTFSATGKVILINPAGVVFGAGSAIDLNSFTVSTFDIKDAKNIKGMSLSSQTRYLTSLRDGQGVDDKGRTFNYAKNLTFDSNYTTMFEKAGLDMTELAGKGTITADGATFDHFDKAINTNKALAFVSDNIEYKGSLVKVGDNNNYGDQAYGNVRLVTSDGVQFTYLTNGYIEKQDVQGADAENAKDVTRNISITDRTNDDGTITQGRIESGDVRIVNSSKGANSNISISNSIVKANKLVNTEDGSIYISSSNDVAFNSARLETANTDAERLSTDELKGGKVTVSAKRNINLTDTTVKTAGTELVQEGDDSGKVTFSAGNKLTSDNSKILADGDVLLVSSQGIDLTNSTVQAKATVNPDPSVVKNIDILSSGNINVKNSIANATGNINVLSALEGEKSGNIIIKSDLAEDETANKTFLVAGGKLTLEAANTTLDNASLAYNEIAFNTSSISGLNNVTVANNTTFAKAGTDNITLTTNGDLTFDNATVKKGDVTVSSSGENITADYTTKNGNEIRVSSTSGDLNVINNSDIASDSHMRFESATGNATISDSTMTAGKNLTFIASNGDATAENANLTATWALNLDGAVNATATNSTLTGNDTLKFTAGTGNATATDSNLVALNKLSFTANNEDAIISGSTLTSTSAAGSIAVKGGKNVVIKGSETQDSSLTAIGNINVTADNEDIRISAVNNQGKDTLRSEGNITVTSTNGTNYVTDNAILDANGSLKLSSANDIKFAAQGTEGVTIDDSTKFVSRNTKGNGSTLEFTSTKGDIRANTDEMADISYGNIIKFRATTGDSYFTGDNSLKATNAYFIAGKGNHFDMGDDLQLVNSILYAKESNDINVDGNVILNNVSVQAPSNGPAENVTTTIIATGDITTQDVTKTLGDHQESYNTNTLSFKTVEYKTDAEEYTTTNDYLNLNGSKLIAQTNAVKEEANPEKGSINLKLKGAGNKDNGIELTAQNVDTNGNYLYDEDSKVGPKVTISMVEGTGAYDKTVAVSKIITDKLDIAEGTKLTAASVSLTDDQLAGFEAVDGYNIGIDKDNAKGYIEVRDFKGFNHDADFDLEQPDAFTYGGHFVTNYDKVIDGEEMTVNEKHIISYGDPENVDDNFLLVYNRPINDCGELPPITDDDRYEDDDDPSVPGMGAIDKSSVESIIQTNKTKRAAAIAERSKNIGAEETTNTANSAVNSLTKTNNNVVNNNKEDKEEEKNIFEE